MSKTRTSSYDQYGTTVIVLNEIIDGKNVAKSSSIISCSFDATFDTSKPYFNINEQKYENRDKSVNCAETETVLFAFNRFEITGKGDYFQISYPSLGKSIIHNSCN